MTSVSFGWTSLLFIALYSINSLAAVKKVAEVQENGSLFISDKALMAFAVSNFAGLVMFIGKFIWDQFHSDSRDLTRVITKLEEFEKKLEKVPSHSDIRAVVYEIAPQLNQKK